VRYDHVTRCVVPDISKDHRAFIFRAQAVQEKQPTQYYSGDSTGMMWAVSVQKGWSASWGSVRKARKGTLLDVQWRTVWSVWSLTSKQPHGWWIQNWGIRQCDKNCQPLLDHTTHIPFPLFIPLVFLLGLPDPEGGAQCWCTVSGATHTV